MVPDDDSILEIHLIRRVPTLQDVRVRKPYFVVEVSLLTQEKPRFPELKIRSLRTSSYLASRQCGRVF